MVRWMLLAGLLAGCKGSFTPVDTGTPTPTDTDGPTSPPTETGDTDPPTPAPVGPEYLALPASTSTETHRFATSDTCESCHSNHSSATAMRDSDGNGVGMMDTWEATMMANSSRDPIWRAVVSAEVAATPGAADVIGVRCMTCHAPMASREAQMTGATLPTVATLSSGSDIGQLGLDGVSCTLCHQIDPGNFMGEESWKGNYLLYDDRTLYGPHTAPATTLMEPSGWTPAFGDHMTDSRLCATCHTLITEALQPDGTPTGGSLVEQAPYLEMLNSSSNQSSCQNCHLPPRADDESGISTYIARTPSGPDFSGLNQRSMARHVLVGGNSLVPELFATYHEILNPRASVEAFEAKADDARFQLRNRTALLYLEGATRTGSQLTFDARIEPRTGHKFPTGIPLRRAWLSVTVTDGNGAEVFRSGAYDSRGRILDASGQVAAFEAAGGPIEPHHDTIDQPDQVQIYEAIMQDDAGQTTFLLLRGAGFEKDNRLLPVGWSSQFVDIDRIRPQGVDGDNDYLTGSDVVHFDIDVGTAPGPFDVDVRLVYQTLSNRFAQELFTAGTPETDALRAMLDGVNTAPETVATGSRTVP